MTQTIQAMLSQLKDKSYRALRTKDTEVPIIYPLDLFGFNFGSNSIQPHAKRGNITPNYNRILSKTLETTRSEILSAIALTEDTDKKLYGEQMLDAVDECIKIRDDHKNLAKIQNNLKLYNAIERLSHSGAHTFYEACVALKMCIYLLRRSGIYHLGLGRFDQYMYPYYKRDIDNGVSAEELFDTLEAFFISLNYDSDLYIGLQQGDNGQSMVLGGFDAEGNYLYNELSGMCMRASLELSLIDPKINIRVGKNTPDEIYELGTLLTKQGLGFPQYSNDDVVIPGLIKLGYAPEDAQNYIVAACWEFIIPCGSETPNIATMNFPLVVNNTVHEYMVSCPTFDDLMDKVCFSISEECDRIIESKKKKVFATTPLLSVFTDGCIEALTDMWHGGAKYCNFGCHGAGIANAADALAAIKSMVYDRKLISAEELLRALDSNFDTDSRIRNMLSSCPKMGNNDDYVDNIAISLMSCFAKNMNGKYNGHNGIWRAGTGSAQEYIKSAIKCPATADGRRAGDPYSSSFSPSLTAKCLGLLSVVQSFTKYDMTNIINGGPLTVEIHDTVLRNDVGVKKTAMLVKNFILLGGHQLQLNSISRERLLDAKKHPEQHSNLIVRVWGWSGYFNELDTEYQDHIISRAEYSL